MRRVTTPGVVRRRTGTLRSERTPRTTGRGATGPGGRRGHRSTGARRTGTLWCGHTELLRMCLVRCMRAAGAAPNRAYIHTKLIVWLMESLIQPCWLRACNANDGNMQHPAMSSDRAYLLGLALCKLYTSLVHVRSNTYNRNRLNILYSLKQT